MLFESSKNFLRGRLRQRLVFLSWLSVLLFSFGLAQADELIAVQIGPMTGPAAGDAREVNEGIRAHLAQFNKRGGVRASTIRLVLFDDQRDPAVFGTRLREAMQLRPIAVLSPIGSTMMKKVLEEKLLDAYDVIVLNAIPGAQALRDPGHPKLFHLRAGDRQEISRLVQHAATLGITRISILHHDAPVGQSGAAVAAAVAKTLPGMTVSAVQSGADPADLQKAARLAMAGEPQCTLVLGAPSFIVAGVNALRTAGANQHIYVTSDVPTSQLMQVVGTRTRGIAVTQSYPNPMGLNTPLQREFQTAMRQTFPDIKDLTPLQFEGFITARVLTEGLRRARASTPTALSAALHAEPIDLAGFSVDFTHGNVGSRFVDIGVITAEGKLMY